MKNKVPGQILSVITFAAFAAALFFVGAQSAFAAVTVTAATGGSTISADTNTTNGTATWTTLTGPTITETSGRAISTGSGTIVLTAPSGFSYNTGTTVTATITRTSGSGTCFTFLSNTATPASGSITFTITGRDSNTSTECHATFSNIQVRPTAGTPLATGNITNTGSNAQVPSGAGNNYGTLTEVAGAKNKLIYTAQPPTTATTSVNFTADPVIHLEDQYGNTETSDSASTVSLAVVLSTQSCGGTAGSGTLTSTPASGAAVTAGVMTYTAMQYSTAQNIKICATSSGVTSALSNAVTVSAPPAPTLTSISPATAIAGTSAFTLTANGANYTASSSIDWNSVARATGFVSASQATTTINTSDIASVGNDSITVSTPGAGTSSAQTFTVTAMPSSLIVFKSATSTSLNGTATTITVNKPAGVTQGDTEVAIIAYRPNTETLTAPSGWVLENNQGNTFNDADGMSTYVLLAGASEPASYTWTLSAGSTGSTGAILDFSGVSPTTPVNAVSSSAVLANQLFQVAPSVTTTVSGAMIVTAYADSDANDWSGVFDMIEDVDAFSAAVPNDVGESLGVDHVVQASAGATGTNTSTIPSVVDADAGQAVTLALQPGHAVPTTTSISPTSTTAGGAQFTITVNGTGFDSSSTVDYNGSPLVTTFVSYTQVTAIVPAAYITVGGTGSITVVNPTPGGGTSNAQTFTINNPIPTTTSISPTSTTAGGPAFTLTVTGTNFNASSTVDFNGSPRSTIFVSSTTVTATITAGDIATAGTASITVVNPAPGGGTSNAQTLTVDNPIPTTTSISPTSTTAGGPAFTLTVTGTNFNASSTIDFNGVPFTTTFISSTTVTITVPSSSIAVGGTDSIAVVNPGPGGGTSGAQMLTVNNPVPVLTSISPTSTVWGSSGFTLTLTGTNFNASSSVQWNGSTRTTIFVSSTTLQASILTSDLTTPTTSAVTVVNPAPGGGTSSTQTFTVTKANQATLTAFATPSTVQYGATSSLSTSGGSGTGAVTFSVDGSTGCSVLGSVLSVTNAAGTCNVTATKAADNDYNATTSPAIPVTLTAATSSVTVTCPAPPQPYTGLPLTPCTASYTTSDGLSGSSTVTYADNVNVGTATASSTYAGDANHESSANASTFTISEATSSVTVACPAPPQPYTGSPLTPCTASYTTSDGLSGSLTVSYTDNVNVGTATASSTYAGDANHESSANASTFTISEATSSVTVTCPAPPQPYTGLPLTPCTASYTTSDGLSGSSTVTYADNVNVGTATASSTYAGDANHESSANASTFTISEATSSVTVACPAPPQPYTGLPLTPCTASYTTSDGLSGSLTVSYTDNVNVGTATASSTYAGDANHESSANASTFTISEATSSVTVTCPAPPQPYTGLPLTPCTASYTTSDGLSGSSTVTYADNVNVGTATASSTYAGDANHESSANASTFTISEATSSVTVACPAPPQPYTGSPLTPCTASYTTSDGLSGSLTVSYTDNVNVGTATASSTYAGDANHESSANASTFTISEATSSVTVACPAPPQPYTGLPLTPCTASYTTSDGLSGSLTVSYTDNVNVGTATASSTYAGDANHESSANASTFTIFNAANSAPTLTAISPTSTIAGNPGFTLTLTGTGFISSSTVNWNSSPRATIFVSSTTLTATILDSDVATAGTASVTVVTPAPGGGTSNSETFTILNPVPTTTSTNPTSIAAGSSDFTLTVDGTNFVNGSVIDWNGSSRTTTFVSSTEVTAAILAADVNTTGTALITVVNAAPGGGTSNAQTFTITATANPVPAIVSISPTSTTAGDGGFTLTVTGTNFAGNSTVEWNGSSRATTFVSSTTLTALITATDIATAGTSSIAVFNPAPGGGTSGSIIFTINPAPTGPGAIKFVFSNVTSSSVAGNSVMFNILAVNSSGTVDTSFEQGVTLTVSGAGTGGGLVTIVDGIGTSTVDDNVAQTVTLGLQDSQSTGLDVTATAQVTFVAGPVAQFTLNHPGNMNVGTRLGYAVGREDQFGNPVSASGTVAYLYTNSTSSNAAFFNAASGGAQIASVLIPNGATSTNFWYYDDTSGSRTVTASDNSVAPDGATGIIDASDTFSVAPGAVKFIFVNVPGSATAGNSVMGNVEAVDSLGNIDPSYASGVTVTMSGSATGGGLVNLTNGVGTTTITDSVAETITLGFRDTQSTGLGVAATTQIIFNPAPVVTPPGGGPSPTQVAVGIKPGVTITFAGRAYPGASVMMIRKDLGLQAVPVTQAVTAAADGSFLVELNNVTRLTGQTYLLSFVDRNGLIAQTKAYNIPVQDKIVYGNILAAPTLGFQSASVVTKGQPFVITGYATPKATVELFIDGNAAGTVLVNDPTGKYVYPLSTDSLNFGRHSIWAIQKYAQSTVLVTGYTNSLSQDEVFVDSATNGPLLSENASGTYTFIPAANETGEVNPVIVGKVYTKQAESDFSNQESFTVSPLTDPMLDLNGDGVVDIKDLSIFLSYLKNLNADVTNFRIANPNIVNVLDFNHDGVVDVNDLDILIRAVTQP